MALHSVREALFDQLDTREESGQDPPRLTGDPVTDRMRADLKRACRWMLDHLGAADEPFGPYTLKVETIHGADVSGPIADMALARILDSGQAEINKRGQVVLSQPKPRG